MAHVRRRIAITFLLVPIVFGGIRAHERAPRSPFTVFDYDLVRVERVSRSVRAYTWRARLHNRGPAVAGAVAVLRSRRGVDVVDGKLTFGPVKAGRTARSADTFTVRRRDGDRHWRRPWDLRWDVRASGTNRPPVAEAGEPQTLVPGSRAALDGSASTDPEGDALTYRWTLVSRPPASRTELEGTDLVRPSLVLDVPGVYVAGLVVADAAAASEQDTVVISTPNRAPTAHAGADQTVPLGGRAVLDGQSSSDPDGDALAYRWRVVSRPAGSLAALETSAEPSSAVSLDVPGIYTVELVVHDGRTPSAADTVRLSTSNSPPVANAGTDRSAAVGTTVVLDGGTSSDADGDALRFRWALVSGPSGSTATLAGGSSVTPSLRIDRPGRYRVRLVVDDGLAASAPDDLDISTVNTPPAANAGLDVSATVGQAVTLDGSGSSDVDGDPLTYGWSLVARPAGSAALLEQPAAVMPRLTLDRPGTYVAQLLVFDGFVMSPADTVAVTTRNSAPVARAGADQAAVVRAPVALDGSASSDADGASLTFAWSFVSRPAGSAAALVNPTSPVPWFEADREGRYVVQLVVHDGELSSAPDTITVATANSRPVAQAGPDVLDVPVGSLVRLDGSASDDADGHPLAYRWSLLSTPAGSAATLSDPAAPAPVFDADRPGTYVAQLIVGDGLLDSAPDTVLVRTANRPPAAIAGDDESLVLGSELTLDGSASSDPDGDPVVLAWAIVTAPVGSQAELQDAGVGRAAIAFDVAGDYVLRLTATDPSGASDADDVTIRVVARGRLAASFTLSWPGVVIGQTRVQPLTMTNVGGSPVRVQSAEATGDFAVDRTASTCLTGAIPAAADCSVSVEFRPTATGARSGVLSVTSTDGDTATVALDGFGLSGTPRVSVTAEDAQAAESGRDPGVFRFTRTGEVDTELTVTYALGGTAVRGADYASFGTSVTFAAGQATVVRDVTPAVDALVEGPETVVLTLTDGATYDLEAPTAATVTIADQPVPVVSVEVIDGSVSEAGDAGLVRFARTGDTSAALTFSFIRAGTASNGSDYNNISSTLTFPAGQATLDRAIVPINDANVEGPETVTFAVQDGASYDPASSGAASVTIQDQPTPIITVQAVDPIASETGLDTGTFRFFRVGDVSFPLVVTFTRGGTAGAADTASLGTSITFPARQATVDRAVAPVADAQAEGPETVTLTLADGAHYDPGVPAAATVTISD